MLIYFTDCANDLGYKVPKLQIVEQDLIQTSAVKYENEDVPKLTTTYDTPRRTRHVSPPPSLLCSNNLSTQYYTVLKNKKQNSYQNDTQLNIDLGNDKSALFKDSDYEINNALHHHTTAETDLEMSFNITLNEISDSTVGYVNMDTINRRVSSVDPGSRRVVKESTPNRRASSVEPGPSRIVKDSTPNRRASSAYPIPNERRNITEEMLNIYEVSDNYAMTDVERKHPSGASTSRSEFNNCREISRKGQCSQACNEDDCTKPNENPSCIDIVGSRLEVKKDSHSKPSTSFNVDNKRYNAKVSQSRRPTSYEDNSDPIKCNNDTQCSDTTSQSLENVIDDITDSGNSSDIVKIPKSTNNDALTLNSSLKNTSMNNNESLSTIATRRGSNRSGLNRSKEENINS